MKELLSPLVQKAEIAPRRQISGHHWKNKKRILQFWRNWCFTQPRFLEDADMRLLLVFSPPYPQMVLLHPLLAPQSSPHSPQFSDKTLFLECNARHTDSGASPVSGPLSLSVWFLIACSLLLCPCSAVVFGLSPSPNQILSICCSLWFNLYVSISHVSPLTTPIALKEISHLFVLYTHIHSGTYTHTFTDRLKTFKSLSFLLLPSIYDYLPPSFCLEPALILSVSHSPPHLPPSCSSRHFPLFRHVAYKEN